MSFVHLSTRQIGFWRRFRFNHVALAAVRQHSINLRYTPSSNDYCDSVHIPVGSV